jgi:hypothetical protein
MYRLLLSLLFALLFVEIVVVGVLWNNFAHYAHAALITPNNTQAQSGQAVDVVPLQSGSISSMAHTLEQ